MASPECRGRLDLSIPGRGTVMANFHVIAGASETPEFPVVRRIGPADLKDVLRNGFADFWAMPSQVFFLGLIYPIVSTPAATLTCAYHRCHHSAGREGWLERRWRSPGLFGRTAAIS